MSALNFTKMHGAGNDFVVLDGPPLSVWTHVQQTVVEGQVVFDRSDPADLPRPDPDRLRGFVVDEFEPGRRCGLEADLLGPVEVVEHRDRHADLVALGQLDREIDVDEEVLEDADALLKRTESTGL